MFGLGKKKAAAPATSTPAEFDEPVSVAAPERPSAHARSNQTKVPSWWASQSPAMRMVVTFTGVFLIAAVPGWLVTQDAPKQAIITPAQQVAETNMITPTRRDVTLNSIDALGQRVVEQQQTIEILTRSLDNIQKNQVTLLEQRGTTPFMAEELTNQVKVLNDELTKLKASGVGSGPAPALNDPLTPPKPAFEPASAPVPPPPPKLRTIGEKRAAPAETASVEAEFETLLAGAIFEGVLINGMDAPTSAVTQRNPVPALFRVKTDATLPNLYTAGVKECFVIMAGFGVMATERVMVRAEKMTCVRPNGKPLDIKLDAYLVGEDGKVGLRGRLVSKQGQIIAKSLTAGFIDGIGKAASPSTTQQLNVGSTGLTAGPTPGFNDIARSGALNGVSQAASQISKFYLEMAQQMFPVLEIDAGRRATLIILQTVQLGEASAAGKMP